MTSPEKMRLLSWAAWAEDMIVGLERLKAELTEMAADPEPEPKADG